MKLRNTYLDLIILFLFGKRTFIDESTSLKKNEYVGFKTTYPIDQPNENEWMKMFRVSSLYKVDQRVFFESRL